MKKSIRYLKGYLTISVTGVHAERFLNACSFHEIELWNIRHTIPAYDMNISISDFRKLKPIIKKTSMKTTIKERHGLPFLLYKYHDRQCYLICLLSCIFFLYISTFFLWDIRIEGEMYYSEEMLCEELQNIGIHRGRQKAKINCSQITSFLRESFDEITWASAYVDGTCLNIKIKENTQNTAQTSLENDLSISENIVADCDGIVTDIITRKGVPLVHIGDSISQGDPLVLGELEIKNDAGDVIAYQYVTPDSSIYAKVKMDYYDELPLKYQRKKYTGRNLSTFYIYNRDNYVLSNVFKPFFDEFTTESQVYNLFLNTKIGVKTWREYQIEDGIYTKNEYQMILSTKFNQFCKDLAKKGVQILENSVKIYTESERVFAKGSLIVVKEIGVRQKTEMKELQEGNIYGNP